MLMSNRTTDTLVGGWPEAGTVQSALAMSLSHVKTFWDISAWHEVYRCRMKEQDDKFGTPRLHLAA